MTDNKKKILDIVSNYVSDEKETSAEDVVSSKKVRSLEELTESSDRSIKNVSEHLDRIEAEIIAGAANKKSD